jgi:hypothetical protein
MPPGWERAGPVVQAAIFGEWHWLISTGHAPLPVLYAVRLRLMHGEFEAGPARDQMLITVNEAIAKHLQVDPSDIPGSPLAVPDDPRELTDGGGADLDRRDW